MVSLSMIDWIWVGSNALWILGLAIVVAGWSDRASNGASHASRGEASVRLGLVLVGLGALASRDFLPERVLAGLVTLAVILDAVRSACRFAEGD
jgi:hypothetical protein